MINNMHQNWLQQVTEAVYRAEDGPGGSGLFGRMEQRPLTAAGASVPQIPFQKLLFSATLTQNMEKLPPLSLYHPHLFMPASSEEGSDPPNEEKKEKEEDGEKKYTLPEGFLQYYVPCSLRWKPLYLLYFFLRLKFSHVLCFVNSRETSHRLFLLVQAFRGVAVAKLSSRLTPSQRKKSLKDFEWGKIQLLISTDATAREINIAGLKFVISYDAPQIIRTYIHQ